MKSPRWPRTQAEIARLTIDDLVELLERPLRPGDSHYEKDRRDAELAAAWSSRAAPPNELTRTYRQALVAAFIGGRQSRRRAQIDPDA